MTIFNHPLYPSHTGDAMCLRCGYRREKPCRRTKFCDKVDLMFVVTISHDYRTMFVRISCVYRAYLVTTKWVSCPFIRTIIAPLSHDYPTTIARLSHDVWRYICDVKIIVRISCDYCTIVVGLWHEYATITHDTI